MENKENAVGGKSQGLSSLTLHIAAMVFMFCDHLWATLVQGNLWLTCVGRLAFPIFAFLLAEGFYQTHNRKKYLRRLFLFALLAEVPFDLMYDGTFFSPFHQNVMWTLLLSFLLVGLMERVRRKKIWWLTVAAIVGISFAGWLLGTVLMVDYHGEGVLTVIIFYLFRGNRWWQRLGQFAGLLWINCVMLGGMTLTAAIGPFVWEFPQQGFALLTLPFIWSYHGRQGYHNRVIQIACYAFYPVHMLVLSLLAMYL